MKPEHGKIKQPRDPSECVGCGSRYQCSKCRFAICWRCSKRGPIVKVCRSKPPSETPSSPWSKSKVHSRPAATDSCYTVSKCQCSREHIIGHANTSLCKKIHITVTIEGNPCKMEVDTSSALSLVLWCTIKWLVSRLSKRQLDPRLVHLKDY